jgi:hypothetical protein
MAIANESFVFILAMLCTVVIIWACRTLPAEDWQILAAVPVAKDEDGRWRGVNLTYYGAITASAAVAAVALLCVLLTAIRVPLLGILALVAGELALCLPAAKLIARVVEKKPCTFTVSGASFVGILLAPWAVGLVNWGLERQGAAPMSVTAALAAILISYAFGEGLGRLACISFGCCYGKPVSQLSPLIRAVFERWYVIFSGQTKKIAYASGLAGERVIPIQAMTASLYIGTGILTTHLFLRAHYVLALVLSLLVTQGWRIVSETLRADYRGDGTISAYQVMSMLSVPYAVGVGLVFTDLPIPAPNVMDGLRSLWHPLSRGQ